ncbi:MAG: hypothetical protein M1830_000266 [Pleopsidium flavum]|nr:MAG: hypothetical protein M1830_000266 [Pleopsidium flavum]
MPYMNSTATSLEGSHRTPKASYGEENSMQWPTYQDCSPYYQDSSSYQTTHDTYNGWYESSVRFSMPAKPTNGLPWEYGFPHESSIQYSSSACPRSYPHDLSLDINGCIDSVTNAYPPSAYHLDAQNHASCTTRHQQSLENGLLAEPNPNLRGVRISNEQYQPNSPAPSQSSALSSKVEMCPAVSPASAEGFEGVDCTTTNGDETDGDAGINSEPYAQLIFKALMSASQHRMVLKDIYEWFEKNTDKAKNNSSKGWQNSIRHNLSMNGAFKKVDQQPPSDDSKKGFIWVLEPSAINEGVKSTTRYRKNAPNKKIGKSETPAPQRQKSGAKGGKAARKAAKLRRSARLEDLEHCHLMERAVDGLKGFSRSFTIPNKRPSPDAELYQSAGMPYHLEAPLAVQQPSTGDHESFGFGDITGCVTTYPHEPLFYDESERGEDSISSEYPLSHCKDDFWDLSLLTD